jgi:hypothetical protein
VLAHLELLSQPDESKRAEKMFELAISSLFFGLDESKADKLTLEPILGCFHSLDEKRCSPNPKLFSQLDEIKRVEKMLEVTIPSLFRLA